MAPSSTRSERSTSTVKSTWPGVSMMLMRYGSPRRGPEGGGGAGGVGVPRPLSRSPPSLLGIGRGAGWGRGEDSGGGGFLKKKKKGINGDLLYDGFLVQGLIRAVGNYKKYYEQLHNACELVIAIE